MIIIICMMLHIFWDILLAAHYYFTLGCHKIESYFPRDNFPKPPPYDVPEDLYKEYTMNNQIPVAHWYLDSRTSWWSTILLRNAFSDRVVPKVWTNDNVYKYEKLARQNKNFHPLYLDEEIEWFCSAVDEHGGLKNKTVLIVGSTDPAFEGYCVSKGAKQIDVLEYHPIISQHQKIRALQPKDIDETFNNYYDVCISFSSFEHDGLGRYSDPLDPNADIKSMQQMKKLVKTDGLMFLSIPMGKDLLVWNAHRIYGDIRLPKLIENWKLLEMYGCTDDTFKKDPGDYHWFFSPRYMCNPQPTLVLKNIEN